MISGSKSNIPSGVPSETFMSETLLAGDVLGVVKYGLVCYGRWVKFVIVEEIMVVVSVIVLKQEQKLKEFY